MNYTIYEKDTGRIAKTVGVPEILLPLQYDKETQGYVEGTFNDTEYYIEDGEPKLIPTKPGAFHAFDYGSKAWVDPRTLDDLKTAKWEAIKRQRAAVEFGKFTYNGMEFDGDVNAQRRLMNLISVSKSALQAGTAFSTEFILADNSVVMLTAADFVAIEMVKIEQVAAAFAKAATLRAQIDSAGSAEEIQSLSW